MRGSALESGAPGFERSWFVEIPVIHRHAVLAGKDSKHCLGLLRSGRGRRLLAQGSSEVIDRGRAGATFAVGDLDHRELLRPSCTQDVLGDAASGLAFTSGERSLHCSGCRRGTPLLHCLFDVGPALRKCPQDGFGDVSQFAQAVVPYLPGEAERRQLGPQCGPVESSRRSSSR